MHPLLVALKPERDKEALDWEICGRRVAKARKALNICQKSLAIEMGFNQPYLSDLEHGRRKWTVELFQSAIDAMQRLLQ